MIKASEARKLLNGRIDNEWVFDKLDKDFSRVIEILAKDGYDHLYIPDASISMLLYGFRSDINELREVSMQFFRNNGYSVQCTVVGFTVYW